MPTFRTLAAFDRNTYTRTMRKTGVDDDRIARIKITVDGSKPAIWRRIEIRLSASLADLHQTIQAIMLYRRGHLFQFDVGERGDQRHYGVPDPADADWIKMTDASSANIGSLLDAGVRGFSYTYDFSDNWRHTIMIEAVGAADPTRRYPRFVDGARRAPPEDIGGWPGFEQFLEIMTKPRHAEHKELVRWYGRVFDPDDIGLADINRNIEALHRQDKDGRGIAGGREPSR
jgi:Plasmid pRiA4b ORF-3-like protein